MGRRGPKPEPAAIKAQKGSSRRPIGKDATAEEQARNLATGPDVQPPEWLDKDGLKVWRHLAERLKEQKLLSKLDAWTFGRYCQNFAEWIACKAEIKQDGRWYTIETASGIVRRLHPLIPYTVRLNRELAAEEANFALNPAERQRLFAARANTTFGDLFDGRPKREAEPKDEALPNAAPPPSSAKGIGFLN